MIIAIFTLSIAINSCSSGGSDNNEKSNSSKIVPIKPSAGYLSRKAQYLQYCNDNNGPGSGDINGQVCRAYTGAGTYNEDEIYKKLAKLDDFGIASVLRILFIDRQNPTLSDTLRTDMNNAVLNFKYWYDEPGPDDFGGWWSENHQILFHSAELLAGILFPDIVFPTTGMTGLEHIDHARPLLHKWLDYRGRFGFAEWHSNVYFNEDMPALINLVDFADEKSVRTKAAMLLDILAFDMASNFYQGLYATTHGRTYPTKYVGGLNDSIRVAAWIMLNNVNFGVIDELDSNNFTAAFLATSDNYWTPAIIEHVADDMIDSVEHRQRDSIKMVDGASYGITYTEYADVVFWWGMTGYLAPEIIDGSMGLIEAYNLWAGNTWKDLAPLFQPFSGTPAAAGIAEELSPMSRGSVLEEANTYTYRTPYYQLSGVQDWKQFAWTGQVVAWQATLDKDCFVITSFPASLPLGAEFGSDWTGGFMPRGTINKNVGIFQYHQPAFGTLEKYFGSPIDIGAAFPDWTHAYFPRTMFDEYVETGNWVIGKKGGAYLALYSSATPVWSADPVKTDYELIANDTDNVWIVELGDVENNGTFDQFKTSIENAAVAVGSSVTYNSPSQGIINVGWFGPMLVNGEAVDLGPYARWDNPYSYQEFGTTETRIKFKNKVLVLDFAAPKRFLIQK